MKTLIVLLAMLSCTVTANLLLKLGATPMGSDTTFGHLLNWRILFGLISFGLSACLYVILLQWLPLNVAQCFAVAQFVAVIIASAVVLSEPIQLVQWLGVACITLGIGVVAWSQR